jgi:hypothetical protein
VALATGLIGCGTSSQVTLAPVGPNPASHEMASATEGQLEVFSAMRVRRDGPNTGFNPKWFQHADYDVYTMNGQRVRHVFNSVSHYGSEPATVGLPAGEYLVKAPGQDYLEAQAPVVIKGGLLTSVHLDDKWQPPVGTTSDSLVMSPSGHPVGWRVDAPPVTQLGMK